MCLLLALIERIYDGFTLWAYRVTLLRENGYF